MAAPQQGSLFADRYRLTRRLGGTGIGEVWEAQDERLERHVAIKIIQPRFARDNKRLERFELGAKSVAKLSSPHVVQLLDFGVATRPFMVMELLDGVVLKEPLEAGHHFSHPVAVNIVVQTAKALEAAHQAEIIHRKLEPGNVFLVGGLDDPFVKVFDFGTAKWLTGFKGAQDITTMGAILGAPHYVAPEQLSGDERSDHRADIWSLAAIAYHLLVGHVPFPGTEIGEVMRKILTQSPPKPSVESDRLTEDADAFFEQALAKDRDHRFQSAKGMASALCDVMGIDVGPSRISVEVAPKAAPVPAIMGSPIIDVAGSNEAAAPAPAPAPTPAALPSDPVAATAAEAAEGAFSSFGVESSDVEPSAAPQAGPQAESVEPYPLSVPPSLPVERVGKWPLILGAFVALGVGGWGAYWMFGSARGSADGPEPAGSASTGSSADSTPPDLEASASATTSSSAAPTASATASASASASATTSASASASAAKPAPRYHPPSSWRNHPQDIYEP